MTSTRPSRTERVPGDGSRDDPYRWGRIVAAKVVRQCAVPGQSRNLDDLEEVGSLSALVVTRCLQSYDPAKAKLSTYIARAVIRAVVRWVRYEYRYRTFTCPLDAAPDIRTVAQAGDDEPGGWESCIEASVVDEYDLGEREWFARQVEAAMAGLPEPERQAIVAYYWRDDGGYREVAPELGVSFETARRRVHRGERRLASALEGRLGG